MSQDLPLHLKLWWCQIYRFISVHWIHPAPRDKGDTTKHLTCGCHGDNPTRAGCGNVTGWRRRLLQHSSARISPSVKVSCASETKQLRLNVTDKASTTKIGFTTTMIQALEHDAYIINANIVRAIVSFVKTGDSSMILRLPDLVREYETTRLLVIASKSWAPWIPSL